MTELDPSVQPLVLRQIGMLDADGWRELLGLIKDANPIGGKVHTYPRSLGGVFGERFLSRYLQDDPTLPPTDPHRVAREPRYYKLFVACTPRAEVPRYVIGALGGQRHELDELLLESLTLMSREEFKELIEFVRPAAWPGRLGWALGVATTVGDLCEMLATLLDVLAAAHRPAALRGRLVPLLVQLLSPPLLLPSHSDGGGPTTKVLQHPEARGLLRQRLPPAEGDAAARALWLLFYRESWMAGAPYTLAELRRGAHVTDKTPLTSAEVGQLGVDVPSYKLMVEQAPSLAVGAFAYRIFEAEPAFAASLSEAQLLSVRALRGPPSLAFSHLPLPSARCANFRRPGCGTTRAG